MKARDFGAELMRLVNAYLAENRLVLARGTIVDVTLIHAPSSMKSQERALDPEMQQTKKGTPRILAFIQPASVPILLNPAKPILR